MKKKAYVREKTMENPHPQIALQGVQYLHFGYLKIFGWNYGKIKGQNNCNLTQERQWKVVKDYKHATWSPDHLTEFFKKEGRSTIPKVYLDNITLACSSRHFAAKLQKSFKSQRFSIFSENSSRFKNCFVAPQIVDVTHFPIRPNVKNQEVSDASYYALVLAICLPVRIGSKLSLFFWTSFGSSGFDVFLLTQDLTRNK